MHRQAESVKGEDMDGHTRTIAVFRSSPRKHGNTNSLTDYVVERLKELGCCVTEFDLTEMNISPCTSCRQCQYDWEKIVCVQDDDMAEIFDAVTKSDLLLLATPIYSWYCTPPMKAMLDRLVYAGNKYYGDKPGPALCKGKSIALVTTCGYPPEKGADLFEEGLKRYCRHSQMKYIGKICERNMGYDTEFIDDQKIAHAKAFAEQIAAE